MPPRKAKKKATAVVPPPPPLPSSSAAELQLQELKLRDTLQRTENQQLRIEISELKQRLLAQERRQENLLREAQVHTDERKKLCDILDKIERDKQNIERTDIMFSPGIIVARPAHMKSFFKTQDEQVAKTHLVPQSEFGLKYAPRFSEDAYAELMELEVLHEAWETVKMRYEELVQAKERYENVQMNRAKNQIGNRLVGKKRKPEDDGNGAGAGEGGEEEAGDGVMSI